MWDLLAGEGYTKKGKQRVRIRSAFGAKAWGPVACSRSCYYSAWPLLWAGILFTRISSPMANNGWYKGSSSDNLFTYFQILLPLALKDERNLNRMWSCKQFIIIIIGYIWVGIKMGGGLLLCFSSYFYYIVCLFLYCDFMLWAHQGAIFLVHPLSWTEVSLASSPCPDNFLIGLLRYVICEALSEDSPKALVG